MPTQIETVTQDITIMTFKNFAGNITTDPYVLEINLNEQQRQSYSNYTIPAQAKLMAERAATIICPNSLVQDIIMKNITTNGTCNISIQGRMQTMYTESSVKSGSNGEILGYKCSINKNYIYDLFIGNDSDVIASVTCSN